MRFGERAASKLTKLFPGVFWNYLDRQSRKFNLDRLHVILSFDCDTPEDAAAAEKLYRSLERFQFKAAFAVPGEQLKEGADVYRTLAKKGVPFLNHGYLPHTKWGNGRYESTTFYSGMSLKQIEDDIRHGHEIVREITGKEPRGFRTPHFGSFQKISQISLVHRFLEKMDYVFSSSTVPFYQLTHGIFWRSGKLYEIPHSGSFWAPLTVFDSYSHLPTRNYGALFSDTIEQLLKRRFCGVLNFYADPSHVENDDGYHRALEILAEKNVSTLHFEDLMSP